MNHNVRASLPHKGKTEVSGMRFKPAENGLTSETEHRTARGGQGGGPSFDHHTETMIHPNMNHAVKHLKSTFAHIYGAQPEPEGEPKPEIPAPPMPGVKAAPKEPDSDDVAGY